MADHGGDKTALNGAQFKCCAITEIDKEKCPEKSLSITSLTSKGRCARL